MSTLSFKIDQLFMLLVPDLVVDVGVGVGTVNLPDEVEFVQKFLSIKLKFVSFMRAPLLVNPHA
jgi:hypothetical protein